MRRDRGCALGTPIRQVESPDHHLICWSAPPRGDDVLRAYSSAIASSAQLAKKESAAVTRLSSSAGVPTGSPTEPPSDRSAALVAGANEVTGAGALGAVGVP